jgi:hypothetical protein
MGFFRRAKDGLGIVQTGLEVSREQQRNMPTTTEEMNARMEAMIAKQEASAARAQRVQRLATSGVDRTCFEPRSWCAVHREGRPFGPANRDAR